LIKASHWLKLFTPLQQVAIVSDISYVWEIILYYSLYCPYLRIVLIGPIISMLQFLLEISIVAIVVIKEIGTDDHALR